MLVRNQKKAKKSDNCPSIFKMAIVFNQGRGAEAKLVIFSGAEFDAGSLNISASSSFQ